MTILSGKLIFIFSAFSILFLILILDPSANAQSLQTEIKFKETSQPFDHVINRRGESRLSLFTGLPVVGSAEYAYGISNRLTVGLLGGFTPFEEAIGIRIRTVLYQHSNSYRIYYCTPIIFYPQSGMTNPDPWFITRPNINFEWVRHSEIRYKVGGSLIGSASHQDLFGDPSKSRHTAELWTAIHAGISLPVRASFSFQTELSYVTKGIKTTDDFFGGPPIILITGLSYTF